MRLEPVTGTMVGPGEQNFTDNLFIAKAMESSVASAPITPGFSGPLGGKKRDHSQLPSFLPSSIKDPARDIKGKEEGRKEGFNSFSERMQVLKTSLTSGTEHGTKFGFARDRGVISPTQVDDANKAAYFNLLLEGPNHDARDNSLFFVLAILQRWQEFQGRPVWWSEMKEFHHVKTVTGVTWAHLCAALGVALSEGKIRSPMYLDHKIALEKGKDKLQALAKLPHSPFYPTPPEGTKSLVRARFEDPMTECDWHKDLLRATEVTRKTLGEPMQVSIDRINWRQP